MTSAIEQFGSVVAVLLLLGLALWFLKRRGYAQLGNPFDRGDRRRRIEVMERHSLTPHHSIHLVRVENRTLLIGVAPNCFQLLSDTEGETRA